MGPRVVESNRPTQTPVNCNSVTTSRQRRSARLRRNELVNSQSSEESSCIDLTEEDHDYIDLTSSRISPIPLRPVVLPLSPIEAETESRRSRSNNRRSTRSNPQRTDRSVEIISTPQPYSTVSRTNRTRGRRTDSRLEDSVQILNTTDVINVGESSIDDDDLSSLSSIEISTPPRGGTGVKNPDIYMSPVPVKISCPICMDDVRQIKRSGRQLTSTVCGHIFCSQCIKQSLRSYHNCPTCRKTLRQNQIHPIFL